MRLEGLEPPLQRNVDLNHARLPVPPQPRARSSVFAQAHIHAQAAIAGRAAAVLYRGMTGISEDRTPFDWETRFRDGDTPWERRQLHPAAAHWLAEGVLAPGLGVIVPGCGRAPEVVAFAQAGLHVTAGDVAPTALAWQREQLDAAGRDASLVEADLTQWRPGEPADLVYEQTFLCACLLYTSDAADE